MRTGPVFRLSVAPLIDEYEDVIEPMSSPSRKSNFEPPIRLACSASFNWLKIFYKLWIKKIKQLNQIKQTNEVNLKDFKRLEHAGQSYLNKISLSCICQNCIKIIIC